jgi:hypothetical protein
VRIHADAAAVDGRNRLRRIPKSARGAPGEPSAFIRNRADALAH